MIRRFDSTTVSEIRPMMAFAFRAALTGSSAPIEHGGRNGDNSVERCSKSGPGPGPQAPFRRALAIGLGVALLLALLLPAALTTAAEGKITPDDPYARLQLVVKAIQFGGGMISRTRTNTRSGST